MCCRSTFLQENYHKRQWPRRNVLLLLITFTFILKNRKFFTGLSKTTTLSILNWFSLNHVYNIVLDVEETCNHKRVECNCPAVLTDRTLKLVRYFKRHHLRYRNIWKFFDLRVKVSRFNDVETSNECWFLTF